MELANMDPHEAMEVLNRQMNVSDPRADSLKKPDKKTKIGGVGFNAILTFVKEVKTYTAKTGASKGQMVPLNKREFSVCVPTFNQIDVEPHLDVEKKTLYLPASWAMSEKNREILLRDQPLLGDFFKEKWERLIHNGCFLTFQTEMPNIDSLKIGQVVFLTNCQAKLSPKKDKTTDKYILYDPEDKQTYPWVNYECSLVANSCSQTQLYEEWIKDHVNMFIKSVQNGSQNIPNASNTPNNKLKYGDTLLLRTDKIERPADLLIPNVSSHISNTVSTKMGGYVFKFGTEAEPKSVISLRCELVVNQRSILWKEGSVPIPGKEQNVKVFARASFKALECFQIQENEVDVWEVFAPIIFGSLAHAKPILLLRVDMDESASSWRFNKDKVEGFTTIDTKIYCLYIDVQKIYSRIGIPVSTASIRFTNNTKKPEIPLSADVVRLNTDDCPFNVYPLRKDYAQLGVEFVMLVNLPENVLARIQKEFAKMKLADPTSFIGVGDEIAKILETWEESREVFMEEGFVPKSEAEKLVKSFAEHLDPKTLKVAYFALFPKTSSGNVEDVKMVIAKNTPLLKGSNNLLCGVLNLPPPIIEEIHDNNNNEDDSSSIKKQKIESEEDPSYSSPKDEGERSDN